MNPKRERRWARDPFLEVRREANGQKIKYLRKEKKIKM